MTRLGEGIDEHGEIAAAARDRTVAAIAGMVDEAKRSGVLGIAVVGTAGLRAARNRDDVVAAIHAATGVQVEVISGEEEGRLAYVATKAALGLDEGSIVVFDTGGGSTQFTMGHGATVDERFSVPVGAVRFTERFGLDGIVAPSVLNDARAAIAAELARIDGTPRPDALVAMGGAVTNMAAVMHGLARYDPEVVQGTVLDRAEIDRQIELYRSRDAAGRREIVGLQPARAEVILAGVLVVRSVMEKLGHDTLTVSDRGLRHGLLVERFGRKEEVNVTTDAAVKVEEAFNVRLALLLAAAMFVLVVDTSLMNVSISAVVADLGTTVSGVQSAIALEALVSAAFILISSKVGDLIGRKKAYVLGLLGYAAGALAMVLAQELRAVIIFWAILGGLGASLLLPSMQSLIHGNFEGAAQKRVYALVGAAAAIAAAIGPLLGGFITTFLSWRVGFLLELIVIVVVLAGIRMIRDVAYTGPRGIDAVGSVFSVLGMGGIVLGILVWQEGGEAVGALLLIGAVSLGLLAYWLVRRKREGKLTLLDPDLFISKMFRLGITGQMMQQITLGGMMIALPIFLQMVLEYNALQAGLSLAPLSLSMFAVAILAGKRAAKRRASGIIRIGFALVTIGVALILPIVPRADSGLWFAIPLVITGCGLGLLVSQLNNYTLAPISEERISEAAGVNSAAGSFGLSFGLAMAGSVMLATLAITFTNLTEASTVIPPGRAADGRHGARRGCPADEQHRARCAARQPARGDPGRDHPHQHGGPADRPAGGPAGAAHCRDHRVVHLAPHGADPRRGAHEGTGGPCPRVTLEQMRGRRARWNTQTPPVMIGPQLAIETAPMSETPSPETPSPRPRRPRPRRRRPRRPRPLRPRPRRPQARRARPRARGHACGICDASQRAEHPAGEKPPSQETEYQQKGQHDGRGRGVRAQEEGVVPGH